MDRNAKKEKVLGKTGVGEGYLFQINNSPSEQLWVHLKVIKHIIVIHDDHHHRHHLGHVAPGDVEQL